MVARYRPCCRVVTVRHRSGFHSNARTACGSSPPVSQLFSTGASRSARVADELSYSPVNDAHQNHRLSFDRMAPCAGPVVASTSFQTVASGMSIGS